MRPIIFSLFLWPISIVPSLQATPDLTYLNLATQAANWILSREVDEKPKVYYGNAGTLVFLHELNRAAGREEYAEAIERGIRFLEENLPNVKLYGLYDGVTGIAFRCPNSRTIRALRRFVPRRSMT
jgi:hypothetical protein